MRIVLIDTYGINPQVSGLILDGISLSHKMSQIQELAQSCAKILGDIEIVTVQYNPILLFGISPSIRKCPKLRSLVQGKMAESKMEKVLVFRREIFEQPDFILVRVQRTIPHRHCELYQVV
jgi:hypothetical protein